jgi:hypothetical protein
MYVHRYDCLVHNDLFARRPCAHLAVFVVEVASLGIDETVRQEQSPEDLVLHLLGPIL